MKLAYWIAAALVIVVAAAVSASGGYLFFQSRPTLEWSFSDIQNLRDWTFNGQVRTIHFWTGLFLPLTLGALLLNALVVTRSRAQRRMFGRVACVLAIGLGGAALWTGNHVDELQRAVVRTERLAEGELDAARAAPRLGAESDSTAGNHATANPLSENAAAETAALTRGYVCHAIALPALLTLTMVANVVWLRPQGANPTTNR